MCSQQRPCVADTVKMNVFFWKKKKKEHLTAEHASADEVLSETFQLGLAILSVLEPNMLHSILQSAACD